METRRKPVIRLNPTEIKLNQLDNKLWTIICKFEDMEQYFFFAGVFFLALFSVVIWSRD